MGKFDTYGCGPRCLIEAARRKEISIGQEDFIKRFGDEFPIWKQRDDQERLYEGLVSSVDDLVKPATELGLKSEGTTSDYASAKKARDEGKIVIVNAKKFSTSGRTGVTNHMVLLEKAGNDDFSLWCPSQCGNDFPAGPFSKSRWQEMDCKALIVDRAKSS